MALGTCRECGKQVSSEAKSCPHCGVDSPIPITWTAYGVFKAVVLSLIAICIFLIAANIIANVSETAKKQDEAEQKCLVEHPLTSDQVATREHFGKCWQYRHTSSSVWSDNQRRLMLSGEGCYSDDRDDPRYPDANWNLCKSR